ncbi:MAG: hypothetical protein KUL86_10905 [Castellaniella sp.]|nr:hypothetical protein [Castellaniella sp.]
MTLRTKTGPTCIARFLAVVAECGPQPTSVIARRSGLTQKQCNGIAARLIAQGRISRRKPKLSEGGGYYRYFMDDDQLCRARGSSIEGLKGVGAVEAVDRLRFLRRLKESPAYCDSAALNAIIDDYQRTLRLAAEGEQS